MRSPSLAALLGVSSAIATLAAPAFATSYPGFIDVVTDSSAIFSVPSVDKPGYLAPGLEPTFGPRLLRIANDSGQPLPLPGTTGVWGTDSRHHYSKDQPWNADGTLFAIQNPGSGGGVPTLVLLDGETFQPKYGPCGYGLDDFRWHPALAHAHEMIGVRQKADSLVWFDAVTCNVTRGWKLPFAPNLIGQGEGNPSFDGRFIAMANSQSIVVVDMDPQPPFASYASGNRRIGPVYSIAPCSLSVSGPTTCNIGNIGISASGKYVDIKFSGSSTDSTADAHRILEVDPLTLELKPHVMADDAMRCSAFQSRPNGWIFPLKHADMTLDPFDNNEDVIVGGRSCPGSDIGHVVKVRLRDGQVTELTGDAVSEASVRHVSARNLDRPGWVYVSYYEGAGKRFNDEIVAVKLDGSQQVQRFAHQHSLTTSCYRCEPHAVPSRDGRRIVWASNWSEACITCGATNEIKDYVVDARAVEHVDHAPVVAAPAAASAREGAPLSVTITASDPDGDPITALTADLSQLPAGGNAQFTANAQATGGTLTWTPVAGDARPTPYTVMFTAQNALTGSATTSITVAADRAPVITAPSNVNGNTGVALTVNVAASDPDGDAIASLTANLAALPAGNDAQFVAAPGNTSGTLTWTPSAADTGGFDVSFTASNALQGSATTHLTITKPDHPPVLVAPTSASVAEGAALQVVVTASDPDSESIGSLTADLSGLPSGSNAAFVVDAAHRNGVLTWTPSFSDARQTPYSVRFTASNALSATATTAITVTNTDAPPVVHAPTSVNASEGVTVSFTVKASDPDGDAVSSLTADLSGLPAGNNATFSVNHSKSQGTFSWTPAAGNGSATPYSVRFIAKNALTGTAATNITVSRVDHAPVVTAPSSLKSGPGSIVTVNVTASDPDGDRIQSLTANLSGLPAGNNAVFTSDSSHTSGRLTWTSRSSDIGSYSVTFTASNALSGSASTTIRISRNGAASLISGGDPAPAAAADLPLTIQLANGRPDPTQGAIAFALELPRESEVRWRVLDLQGRVLRAESRRLPAGRTQLEWDGAGSGGTRAPAGLYFLRAEIADTRWLKRFVLIH